MTELLDYSFLGNSFERWAIAAGAFAVTAICLVLLRRILCRKLTQTQLPLPWRAVGEMLEATRKWFFVAVAIGASVQLLALSPKVHTKLEKGILVILILQVLLWGSHVIRFFVDHYVHENISVDGARATSLRALGVFAQVIFFALVLLWGLDNFGVHVTSLVAGLGIGGVAIALAVQNVLGDLFSALTIVLDKPFVIGDLITIGDLTGHVEKIGFNTTRIRSTQGEEVVISNSDMLKSRIHNFRSMTSRRITFTLLLSPSTSPEHAAKVPEQIKAIVESAANSKFDRAHLKAILPKGFEYEVVYTVTSPDMDVYMESNQSINLRLLQELKALDIELAPMPIIPGS